MPRKAFCIIIAVLLMFFTFPMATSAATSADSPALLKDLDVTNGMMIQFDKDTFTYTVELNEGETMAEVIAVPKSEECTVQIEGNEKKIPPGSEQVVTVSVSDMQGNFATYILKVYSRAQKGGLSFLRCLNGTMSPMFSDTARNYFIIVPNDCDFADLDIRTFDEKATVKITGNENLEEGKRQKAVMTITDTDGVVSEYSLYIYRQKAIESNVNRSYMLSDIQINEGAVPIEFEQTKGFYRIAVPKSVSKLDISAISEDRKNIVEVLGSDVVAEDEDTVVTVTVSNPDDETAGKSVYILEFYRDSYIKTPKYTGFQMTAVIVASVLLTFIILLLFIILIVNKRRKAKLSYVAEDEYDDIPATQDMNDIAMRR